MTISRPDFRFHQGEGKLSTHFDAREFLQSHRTSFSDTASSSREALSQHSMWRTGLRVDASLELLEDVRAGVLQAQQRLTDLLICVNCR